MNKGFLCILILVLPLLMMAQTEDNSKGIKWTTGLSWKQIKQKAKAERKYIFIDAYTTWCGPCKMMDKYVYPNDTVGNYFNEHFIAVKAQMDVTDKDEQGIKDWYGDARRIESEYAVTAYPSLIFLSPESMILYKIEGFRPVQKFVDTAKLVLTNGTVYNDPYREYKALVSEYRQGIKHYDRMPYMIGIAKKLDDSLARELFKDHLNYAFALGKTERYTKENIGVWSSAFLLKLDSKALKFFLEDGKIIDNVMSQKGYASDVVDKTIQSRIVDSFFRKQGGESTIIFSGKKIPNSKIMFMRLPIRTDGKIEPDYVEADWKELGKMIRKDFNGNYAERNVLKAKIRWYLQHQNKVRAAEVYFNQLDKYPPARLDLEYSTINDIAWLTFLYADDKKLLRKALEWMEKLIPFRLADEAVLDTYASLLYKLKRTDEAIRWEEKALRVTNPVDERQTKTYVNIIEKMKKGEPIYIEEGAIWK